MISRLKLKGLSHLKNVRQQIHRQDYLIKAGCNVTKQSDEHQKKIEYFSVITEISHFKKKILIDREIPITTL